MAIVDMTFYTTVYMVGLASECEFNALEARAEDVINAMTRWQLDTIASLPARIQMLAKKAICAQIDYFAVNGLDSVAGGTDRGFTVGKVSVSGKSGSDVIRKGAMAEHISPLALMYLEQSGLMYPAVPVALAEPSGVWY